MQSEKAENYDSDKERRKNTRKRAKWSGDYQPPWKMIVKMMQDLGNKLEAKIDKLQETPSKEIEDLRNKQAEIQNKTEIRNNKQ